MTNINLKGHTHTYIKVKLYVRAHLCFFLKSHFFGKSLLKFILVNFKKVGKASLHQ